MQVGAKQPAKRAGADKIGLVQVFQVVDFCKVLVHIA
jgi:hypothetical protein